MRRSLLTNIVLAFCWTAVTGRLSGLNLLVGFAIGFLTMLIVRPLLGPTHYVTRVRYLAEIIFFFLWDLVGASLRVAADILRPRHRMKSGVVAMDLDVETDAEITVVANLISLMPGTLTLDISEDRQTLYMHVMHIPGEDVEAHQKAIKRRIEGRVRQAFGPEAMNARPRQPDSP